MAVGREVIRVGWQATVRYLVDGTTTETTLIGHRISTQILRGHPPRVAVVTVLDEAGEVVEVFQVAAVAMIHKRRI